MYKTISTLNFTSTTAAPPLYVKSYYRNLTPQFSTILCHSFSVANPRLLIFKRSISSSCHIFEIKQRYQKPLIPKEPSLQRGSIQLKLTQEWRTYFCGTFQRRWKLIAGKQRNVLWPWELSEIRSQNPVSVVSASSNSREHDAQDKREREREHE